MSRATGAIERFIERTLAPRLEELSGEIRGLRGEMAQMDKRITENMTSLRNETIARIEAFRSGVNSRFEIANNQLRAVNDRIDTLSQRLNGRIDSFSQRLDRRIDALNQRLDNALNARERLVALEARFDAVHKRNGG